ncbi:MAG: RNA polymerase subunit sigma-70 [Planctomycetes bacterium RBG_16_64_10]|nr:MAG: RNA polymerase subunit sigma-70 [Planctomycetes bacterium RBG_16_64_10]
MAHLAAVVAPVVRPRERTDESLLLDYRSTGSAVFFGELVRRYQGELFGYLRRFLGDAGAAEDAFQGTFLQVHLKRHQFDEGRRVRPWLYTIATNQAIDAQRRNRRHRMLSLDLDRPSHASTDEVNTLLDLLIERGSDPSARLELEEELDWVRAAIDDLPTGLKAAITLVYFQGLRYREAAEVMAVPVGTVKSRVHAAILRLCEAWTQRG